MRYPETIELWLQLMKPEVPEIKWWDEMGPSYFRIKLVSGEKVIIKQSGNELNTWVYPR